jgi:hypothetical protein
MLIIRSPIYALNCLIAYSSSRIAVHYPSMTGTDPDVQAIRICLKRSEIHNLYSRSGCWLSVLYDEHAAATALSRKGDFSAEQGHHRSI